MKQSISFCFLSNTIQKSAKFLILRKLLFINISAFEDKRVFDQQNNP